MYYCDNNLCVHTFSDPPSKPVIKPDQLIFPSGDDFTLTCQVEYSGYPPAKTFVWNTKHGVIGRESVPQLVMKWNEEKTEMVQCEATSSVFSSDLSEKYAVTTKGEL